MRHFKNLPEIRTQVGNNDVLRGDIMKYIKRNLEKVIYALVIPGSSP
jgi:hypothetical protein